MTDTCTCTHPISSHREDGCAVELCDCKLSVPPHLDGVHTNIPRDEYHALPYVGSTSLKAFAKCPAKALQPVNVTEDMMIGDAIHTWILEGEETFRSRFAILPDSDLNKNTNEYKRLIREFREEHDGHGKVFLPAYPKGADLPMIAILRGVDDSVRSHPFSRLLVNGKGLSESSLIWTDRESGVKCKGRIDRDPGRKTLVELKKCADVSRFQWQIEDMGYDIQAGHYLNGAEACDLEADTFVFIAVEALPPFEVRVGYLNEDGAEEARANAKRLVKLYDECRERDYWPAFKIPRNIYSLDQLQAHDALEEFNLRRQG